MELEELKVEIYGRVQGVMFREYVKQTADSMGLKGYVLNRDDGSVFVIVQGQRKYLKKFLDKVQKGSSLSKVEGVSYFWKKPENNYDNFLIALDKGTIEDQKMNFLNLGKNVLGIKNKVPMHVAIIPDGNRRWAKKKGMNPSKGHEKGISPDRVIALFDEAKSLGIKYITLWLFSTENWNRDKSEVDFLFNLFTRLSDKFKNDALKKKIRFRHLGRKDRLPAKVIKKLEEIEEETKDFSELNVQLCIDYGGRDEITRAVNKMLKSGVKEVKEEDIKNYLDSADIPDPDLIIRTSGEQRTSGLFAFQSAYSELYFTNVHFPDFGPEELRKAVNEFGKRGRRFGK